MDYRSDGGTGRQCDGGVHCGELFGGSIELEPGTRLAPLVLDCALCTGGLWRSDSDATIDERIAEVLLSVYSALTATTTHRGDSSALYLHIPARSTTSTLSAIAGERSGRVL